MEIPLDIHITGISSHYYLVICILCFNMGHLFYQQDYQNCIIRTAGVGIKLDVSDPMESGGIYTIPLWL